MSQPCPMFPCVKHKAQLMCALCAHLVVAGSWLVCVCRTNSFSLSDFPSQQAVPTNTPATPPQLPDTLQQFAQMKASSPAGDSGCYGEPTIVRCRAKAGER